MGSSQVSSPQLLLSSTETFFHPRPIPLSLYLYCRAAVSVMQCTWRRTRSWGSGGTGVKPGKVSGVVVTRGFNFYILLFASNELQTASDYSGSTNLLTGSTIK